MSEQNKDQCKQKLKTKYCKKINLLSKYLSFLSENKHISFLLAIIISFIFVYLLIYDFNINKSFLAFETNNLQNIILGILTVYIPFILLFLTDIKKKIKFDALILLKDIKNIFVVSVVYLLVFSFKFNAFINIFCLISLILGCYKFYYPEFEKLLQYSKQDNFSFEVRQKYFRQLINNKNIIDLKQSWQYFWQETKNKREDEYYDLFFQTIKLSLEIKADHDRENIYELCYSYYQNRENRKNNPDNNFNYLQFFQFINNVINVIETKLDKAKLDKDIETRHDHYFFCGYLLLYSVFDRLLAYPVVQQDKNGVSSVNASFCGFLKQINRNKLFYDYLKRYLQGLRYEDSYDSFCQIVSNKAPQSKKNYDNKEGRDILCKVIKYFFLYDVNGKPEPMIEYFVKDSYIYKYSYFIYQVLEEFFDIKILTEEDEKNIVDHYTSQYYTDYRNKLKEYFSSNFKFLILS